MREYILTVAGAAVLSAFASAMAPEKWQKYIQLVTGIVILCCICSPIAQLAGVDISETVPNFEPDTSYNEDLSAELILKEFSERIEEDIRARMEKEFGLRVSAEVEIELNSENEVEGVKKITTTGDALTDGAKSRLREIYGVDDIYEK